MCDRERERELFLDAFLKALRRTGPLKWLLEIEVLRWTPHNLALRAHIPTERGPGTGVGVRADLHVDSQAGLPHIIPRTFDSGKQRCLVFACEAHTRMQLGPFYMLLF